MYVRNCNCGKEISYKKKDSWKKAINNSSMCPSCRTIKNNKLPHRAKKGQNNPSWKGFGLIPGKVFSRLKRGAESRGISFDITIEDISKKYEEQSLVCALSGMTVSFFGECEASVDRIDSSKGYYYDNIQIVHKHINMMKRDFDNEYFINLCKQIANHKGKYD